MSGLKLFEEGDRLEVSVDFGLIRQILTRRFRHLRGVRGIYGNRNAHGTKDVPGSSPL